MILEVRFMKEAYEYGLRSTREVPEPLIERDWPHHEWRRRGLLVCDDEPIVFPRGCIASFDVCHGIMSTRPEYG